MSDRTERYEDALRSIAAAAITARQRTDAMSRMSDHVASNLLCDVEHALASLIALGAVPPAPPDRRALD